MESLLFRTVLKEKVVSIWSFYEVHIIHKVLDMEKSYGAHHILNEDL